MKKLMIPLMTLAIATSAHAQIKQTWANTYADPHVTISPRQVAIAPDGVSYVMSAIGSSTCRVSSYDGLGTRLWSKTVSIDMATGRIACDSTGAPVVVTSSFSSHESTLVKLNRADGSVAWSYAIPQTNNAYDLDIDASDNILVLYNSFGFNTTPVVKKFSSAGAPLFTSPITAATNFSSYNMAVAANGKIFVSATDSSKQNAVISMTPNGTVSHVSMWENWYLDFGFSMTLPSTVVTDRNGHAFTVELDAKNNTRLKIRTLDSNLIPFQQEINYSNPVTNLLVAMDSDSRLVIAVTRTGQASQYMTAHWLSTAPAGVNMLNTMTVYPDAGHDTAINDLKCDAFGQAYVFGYDFDAVSKARIWALDSAKQAPVWMHEDPNGNVDTWACGAVGRWGQVSMASGMVATKTAESAVGVKQMGFRNMLINGSSFTGGRTITGTANFYSSDVADRNVALASNSPYATVGLTTTVLAGQSQSEISVDLKPTAIRRAIRIDGTYNGTTRSVVFYIEPPVASSVTLFPTTVKGGKNVNATARINGDAPAGGINVTLSSNNPAATTPAAVMIPEGDVTKTFTVSTSTVSQTTTATLSATASNVTKTATLTITP